MGDNRIYPLGIVGSRVAGEDFHLLGKLAKLGSIRALRGDPIQLSGRVSSRVPFGTGAGVAKELQRIDAGQHYPAYDARVFSWLRVWLRTLAEVGARSDGDETRLRDRILARAESEPEVDGALLYQLLEETGAIRGVENTGGRGVRPLHERFDALRTLKFIHALRDRHLPSIPLEAAIAAAPFIPLGAGASLESTRQALAQLECMAPQ